MRRAHVSTAPRQSAPGKSWGGGMVSQVTAAHLGGTCRVCLEPVPARVPACLVPWRMGIAHELCGYLRPDEHEPHEVRVEGRRWWAWRCPTCLRDAAAYERPSDDARVCMRCRSAT